MTATVWNFDASDSELQLQTGVTGRAAAMGHRLTIAVNDWQAVLHWGHGQPTELELTVQVDSLEVVHGEGGVKGLSGPEKTLARSNALGVLKAGKFPEICFRSADIAATDTGYRIAGTLEICGTARPHAVDLQVTDAGEQWHLSARTEVRHSDFGLKPYSMFLGAMKVADAVSVSFSARRDRDDR
ncbi:MAG: YceI family protein [Actinomycetota bacterium]|nr:YceI family protein [Actinomycetota bacterium]